tara:strand:+ start:1277 stop:1678 length:402 start_codon:yes stop_codon:yes gene_type:complete
MMSNLIQLNDPVFSNNRIYSPSGLSPTLNTMQGGRRQPLIAIPVLTPDRVNKRQNERRFKTNGEPAFTLTAQDRHGVYNGICVRKLTPTECELLQGFPKGYTDGHSDSQRYKCLGNAVTANVITALMDRIYNE